MKHYYWKFTLLCAIFAFVGCSKSSNHVQEPVSSAKTITRSTAAAPINVIPEGYTCSNLAIEIGQLHNQAMYNFVDFCNLNNLNPFKGNDISVEMIYAFMENYFVENFNYPAYYYTYRNVNLHICDTIAEKVSRITQDLVHASLCESKNQAMIEMADVMKYEVERCDDFGEILIVEIICSVAMHSYHLWAIQWDWTQDGYTDYLAYIQENGFHPINPAPISDADKVGAAAGAVAGAFTFTAVGVAAGAFLGGAFVSSLASMIAMDEEIHKPELSNPSMESNRHNTGSFIDGLILGNHVIRYGVELPEVLVDTTIFNQSLRNVLSHY